MSRRVFSVRQTEGLIETISPKRDSCVRAVLGGKKRLDTGWGKTSSCKCVCLHVECMCTDAAVCTCCWSWFQTSDAAVLVPLCLRGALEMCLIPSKNVLSCTWQYFAIIKLHSNTPCYTPCLPFNKKVQTFVLNDTFSISMHTRKNDNWNYIFFYRSRVCKQSVKSKRRCQGVNWTFSRGALNFSTRWSHRWSHHWHAAQNSKPTSALYLIFKSGSHDTPYVMLNFVGMCKERFRTSNIFYLMWC